MDTIKFVLMSLGLVNDRWDDNYTAVLAKQLEYVKAQTYDIKYPALKGRQLVPVSNEVDPGAETIVYRQWDDFGMAQIIANYADDLPLADTLVEETVQRVQSIGSAYQYSVQDIRRSAMSGANLEQRRARAARRLIEQKIEDIAAVGDTSAGLTGLANNVNVTAITPITGNWATATSEQIVADLNKLVADIVTTNKESFIPDTIVLDLSLYTILATKRMSTTGDSNYTILKAFLEGNPYITSITAWNKLAKADAAGTGSRIVCYKKDPEVLTLEMPQEFEQLAPQAKNLAFLVPCHARTGGVIVYYPVAMGYMDGC